MSSPYLVSVKERIKIMNSTLNRSAMKDSVEKLSQLADFFLRHPGLFKEMFVTIPEYKRKAFIELLKETDEAG